MTLLANDRHYLRLNKNLVSITFIIKDMFNNDNTRIKRTDCMDRAYIWMNKLFKISPNIVGARAEMNRT